MSRPLVLVAALVFALLGLAPLFLMFARIGADDLATIVSARTGLLFLRGEF